MGKRKKSLLFCFFILAIAFSLSSCQFNSTCRKPRDGELKDVVGISYNSLRKKLAVLSAPRDVLAWCSAFVSVFDYDETQGKLSFDRNFELSDNIANSIKWIKDSIVVSLYNKLEVINYLSGNKLSIDTNLDIDFLSVGSNSVLALSLIKGSALFAENFDDFVSYKKATLFSSLPKGIREGDFFTVEGGKELAFLPLDKTFQAIIIPDNISPKSLTFDVKEAILSGNSKKTEVSSTLSQLSFRPKNSEEVKFISGVKSTGRFLFSLSQKGDKKGVLILDSRCVASDSLSSQNCAWFLGVTENVSDVFPFSLSFGSGNIFFLILRGKSEAFFYITYFDGLDLFLLSTDSFPYSSFYELLQREIKEEKETTSAVENNVKESKSESVSKSNKVINSVEQSDDSANFSGRIYKIRLVFVMKHFIGGKEEDKLSIFTYETKVSFSQE
jgi:hypothetical protein